MLLFQVSVQVWYGYSNISYFPQCGFVGLKLIVNFLPGRKANMKAQPLQVPGGRKSDGEGRHLALDTSLYPVLNRLLILWRRPLKVHKGSESKAVLCALLFLFSAFFSPGSGVTWHLSKTVLFFLLFLAIEVMCCNLDSGLQFMLLHAL